MIYVLLAVLVLLHPDRSPGSRRRSTVGFLLLDVIPILMIATPMTS